MMQSMSSLPGGRIPLGTAWLLVCHCGYVAVVGCVQSGRCPECDAVST